LAVGGKLALPVFAHAGAGTDFNDLHQAEGLEVVRCQVEAAQAPDTVSQAPDWPAPVPFDSFQAAPLPADTLPDWAKDFTLAAAEHLQVAPDLVLANVLGVVATACAGKLSVEVKPGYREPVNLYILAPAPPAERKSAAQALAVGPLLAWESEQAQAMKDTIITKASERKSQEALIAGLRGKLSKPEQSAKRQELFQEIASLEACLPDVPKAPRLLADDLTPEAAAVLMAEHGERLGIISAEGGLFDTLAGRYSAGVPNLDLVLKAHAGDSVRVDRRQAPPVVMQAPALTLCLSPQPEVVRGLMDKPGFRGRGLLGRFAYVLPQSLLGHRTFDAPAIPASVQHAYHAAIHRLLAMTHANAIDGRATPHVLHLSDHARQEWQAFASEVERKLGEGGDFEHVTDWAGKLPGLAARLAGLLHCMEHLPQAPGKPISQPTMSAALELAAGLVGHALAAFRLMGADPDLEAAKQALAWIRREPVEHFTVRDCHRALQGRYPRAAEVQAALKVLEERAFIIPKEPTAKSGPGRTASPGYIVNPKALEV
ncbi:MAG: DUF3987 domain-containing protein, partial [Desulfarculus sp.]|nr:DUF3987 domain-containing protein [Desulfarculus sp.]